MNYLDQQPVISLEDSDTIYRNVMCGVFDEIVYGCQDYLTGRLDFYYDRGEHVIYYVLDKKRVVPTHNAFLSALRFEGTHRQVDHTDIGGGGYVSTVFLGLNHCFDDTRLDVFETMVFDGNDDGFYMQRYATWDEAVQGHNELVQKIKDEGIKSLQ